LRKETRLAYVPQESVFAPDDTIDSVLSAALLPLPLEEREKTARKAMILGRAGFDTSATATAALSGGWRKRLAIAAALVTSPDVLLLDEPTNHLDLESINALNIALQKYDGTVLLVTHDHDLVDEVATRIWHFENREIEDFKGPYADFLTQQEATLA
jgi:ATPase subunit of ABC transporter with duplicated ATPase domains